MYVLIVIIAMRNVIELETFKQDSCSASIAREHLAERFWIERSDLEKKAAMRGYSTAPEWKRMAIIDKEHAALIRDGFNNSCHTLPRVKIE